MRCMIALGDKDSASPDASTMGTETVAVILAAPAYVGYDTETTTLPKLTPERTARTPPKVVASVPPETTVKTVRESVVIVFTAPFANVRVADKAHDVATPTPVAAAAEVGDARREAEQKMAVEMGAGSVTLTVAPPDGARMVQFVVVAALMLTERAD